MEDLPGAFDKALNKVLNIVLNTIYPCYIYHIVVKFIYLGRRGHYEVHTGHRAVFDGV